MCLYRYPYRQIHHKNKYMQRYNPSSLKSRQRMIRTGSTRQKGAPRQEVYSNFLEVVAEVYADKRVASVLVHAVFVFAVVEVGNFGLNEELRGKVVFSADKQGIP